MNCSVRLNYDFPRCGQGVRRGQQRKERANSRMVGQQEVIQMGTKRIKDEPFLEKSRLVARRVTRYFVAGASTSNST